MKLEFFTPDNFETPKKAALPTFTVTKGNLMKFNDKLIDLLDLKEGDKVVLAQDQEHPGEWYVSKNAETGFTLKEAPGTDPSLTINCAGLAKLFREAYPKAKVPMRVPVSPTASAVGEVNFYALLTRTIEKA